MKSTLRGHLQDASSARQKASSSAASEGPAGEEGVPAATACHSASDCEVVGGYRTDAYPLSDLAAASTATGGAKWDTQLP